MAMPKHRAKRDLAGGTLCYDHFPIEAWSRRSPKNPSVGLSDPEARVGKGKRGNYFLGYKVHYSLDWCSELPVAYTVKPANGMRKATLNF